MSLPLLRRGLRLPSMAARPIRSIYSKPAKDPLGPLETAIGLGAFFGACFLPAAYILANLDNYRNRE